MRGKHVLMDTLVAHGVECLFGNPGTTESPIIDSLPDYPQLRYMLALHEGVALGAASYYAQASGRTGVVNLHVAPGLGNALGMLYGALKAGSPLLVTAGQQDTRMRLRAPLLGHDLVAMAAPVVKWSLQVERADELAAALHRALKVAHDPPTGPVFMALPIDVLEQETDQPALPPGALYRRVEPDPAGVAAAAAATAGQPEPGHRGRRRRGAGAAPATICSPSPGASAPRVWFEGLRQHVVLADRPSELPRRAALRRRRDRPGARGLRTPCSWWVAPSSRRCGSPPARRFRRGPPCCRWRTRPSACRATSRCGSGS